MKCISLAHRWAIYTVLLSFALACSSSAPSGPTGNRLAISFTPTEIAQESEATFTITLPPNAAVGSPIILALGGLAQGADTGAVPRNNGELQGSLTVPAQAPDGTLTLTVSLPALAQSATASLVIKDSEPPELFAVSVASVPPSPAITLTPGSAFFVAGVPDTLSAEAEDNHSVAWMGWTLGAGAGDSVQVSGTNAQVTLPMAIPNSIIGSAPDFSVFVRDADGNRAVTDYGPSAIAQYDEHPVLTASTQTGWPSLVDWAFDMGRKVLYLADAFSPRIFVLSLTTMQFQPQIATDTVPTAIDLAPDGNHLVVGLAGPGHTSIEIIDLTSAHAPTVIPISLSGMPGLDTAGQIYSLRVAANNHAVVSVVFVNGGPEAAIDVNLSTGAQQIAVPDTPTYGSTDFVGYPRATRSTDGTHILFGNLTSANTGSTLYTESNASYSTIGPILGTSAGNTFTSADATGRYYQIAHSLVDGSANYIGTLGADQQYGAVLAPNGQDFYVAECATCSDTTPAAVFRYRIPTVLTPPGGFTTPIHPAGQLVEVNDAPALAHDLIITPDGTTLIGIGANAIFAMNLTQTTPASATRIAKVVAPRRASPTRVPRRPSHQQVPSVFTLKLLRAR